MGKNEIKHLSLQDIQNNDIFARELLPDKNVTE